MIRGGVNRRLPLMAMAMLSLVAASWAGLLRLGLELPQLHPTLSLMHGPLMVCGFLGTLISLERAVALGRWWAYLAPLLTGIGALTLIVGVSGDAGPVLITLGSLGLVGSFATIIRRQTALFTVTMGLGALAWMVGNCFWLAGVPITGMFFWWAGFLVLTIVGERLELSRMTGPAPWSRELFLIAAGVYLAGLVIASFRFDAGMRLIGVGMIALTAWLMRYDVARRTIRIPGLTRFIAANLLAGYCWLGAGGLFWLFPGGLDQTRYDAILHAVFIGFVLSMIFAHAPIIFPAVLGRPLRFTLAFYVHVILLHLSLLLRVGGDIMDSFPAYQWGGMMNVLALMVFVANTIFAAAQGGRVTLEPLPDGPSLPVSGLGPPSATRG